jgi:hypothetical protein
VPGPFRFWRVTITVLMCVSLAWMLLSVVKETSTLQSRLGAHLGAHLSGHVKI